MQTMLKCFEFISPEDTSLTTRKIAFKVKTGEDNCASQDAAAFLDYLGALMDMPEGALKSSLDQFKWVPVDGNGESPAAVIDLTATETMPYSLISMLLGSQGADGAEVLSSDLQGKPEDALNDLWPIPAGLEASDGGDSSKENKTPSTDTELGLAASLIDELTNAVGPSDAQQSAAFEISSDKIVQSDDSSEATERGLNENRKNPMTLSYTAKSQFKQIFYPDNNPQTVNSQTGASENSAEGADTQENTEIQGDIKGLTLNPNTRTDGALTSAAGNSSKGSDALKPAEMQRDIKGTSLDPNTKAVGSTTTTPEILPKGMEALKNNEVQQTTNESSVSQSVPQDQPVKSFLNTAKGEGDSVANSLDDNDTCHSNMQQNTFTSENGNLGQHEQSGSMFRQSYQSADAQLNANFKEVAATPDSEDTQSAVQDKALQNDVIRQIVQRMNLRSDHLQSQMSIKLKPEFLGDLRLQISTANQHVSIKMTAESVAVKEMLEANIAVLKNELQQHGLHIDKFDVFVGQESDAWKQREQQTAGRQGLRNRSFRTIQSGEDGEDEDESGIQNDPFLRSGSGRFRQSDAGEIDFFV